MDNRNEVKGGDGKMVVVIKEEDAWKIIKAFNLKKRMRELEKEIGELQRRKAELEEEYAELGVSIE